MNTLLEDETGLETARILTWPSQMSYADWRIFPSVHVHGRFARFVDPELKQPKSRHFEEKNYTILHFHFFITYSLLGHLKGSFSKDKATPVRTARADLTISLANGRAPEVAFIPFRAFIWSRVVLAKSGPLTAQSTLLSSMQIFLQPNTFRTLIFNSYTYLV